jgi:hypothetical protein
VIAAWESIEAVILSGRIPVKHRHIEIDNVCKQATTGTESTLILMNVAERDVLTLQIEQVGREKELSW